MPMQDGGTYWVAKEGDKMVAGIFEMKGGICRRSRELDALSRRR